MEPDTLSHDLTINYPEGTLDWQILGVRDASRHVVSFSLAADVELLFPHTTIAFALEQGTVSGMVLRCVAVRERQTDRPVPHQLSTHCSCGDINSRN